MTYIEKFFELFKKNLKTERLELRILKPTNENAKLIWNVLQHENPEDYKYMWYTTTHKSHLPESVEETHERMTKDAMFNNGVVYYIFYKNQFIGYMRVHYWDDSSTLQCASVWFIKSARGKGFNKDE